MKHPIPTNLILGFLGVGKTTAILELLRHKPEGETWAVLVNEFGEVGIDGALLANEGAFVREVPGGCMCCVAGLPMQIGLNRLIQQARPDRLLIEPTGLGHPAQIVETLTNEHYHDVLTLGPVICLVDPRRLDESRVLENVHFRDQVAAADILVANKLDLCEPAQIDRFDAWSRDMTPAKRLVTHTRHGQLAPALLDGATDLNQVSMPGAHHHHEAAPLPATPPSLDDEPWQMVTNEGQGHFSVGWRVHRDTVLDETGLLTLALDSRFQRFKAVANTTEGWRIINQVDGALSVTATDARNSARLEAISSEFLDVAELDRSLVALRR